MSSNYRKRKAAAVARAAEVRKDDRTYCKCEVCQAACRTMPGQLAPDDLNNIPHDKLCASGGGTAGGTYVLPSILPQQKSNGECVFFENGLCQIHDVKPMGCRIPLLCKPSRKTKRQMKHLQQLRLEAAMDEDGEYAQLWRKLPKARSYASKRAAWNAAMAKLGATHNVTDHGLA